MELSKTITVEQSKPNSSRKERIVCVARRLKSYNKRIHQ